MPTRSRPTLAAKALQCFLDQSYPDRELIILDDHDAPSFPSGVAMDGVHYLRLNGRLSILAKRNRCCEMASGDIVMFWDDDDWYAPTRMADQVRLLIESGQSVTGFHSMLFYAEESKRAVKYIGIPNFNAIGTSLCFTKRFWAEHPFRPNPASLPNVGEDNAFVDDAKRAGQLTTVDGGVLAVACIHAGNTSQKSIDRAGQIEYRPVSVDAIPKAFFQ